MMISYVKTTFLTGEIFDCRKPKGSIALVLFFHFIAMTKQDLIAEAAKHAEVSKKVATNVVEAIISTITKNLKNGENVTITGFGTFRVSKRAARTGVNPRNPSEKIKIPAMKLPAFKAGKTLKDNVR